MNREEALSRLRSGATLVTATPVLAADWRRRTLPAGARAAPAAAIRTWHGWLHECYRRATGLPVPLSRVQEQALWQQVIGDEGRVPHSAVPGLARSAMSGFRLMCEYRLSPRDIESYGEEAAALARWVRTVRSRMRRSLKGRVLEAEMPALGLEALRAGEAGEIAPVLLLDGFERFTPMQEAWLAALKAAGVDTACVRDAPARAEMRRLACADHEEECRRVAARVRELLRRDAEARILVLTTAAVDPEVLRRALDAALIPGELTQPERDVQAVVMPGRRLDRWPLVAQALQMLSLAGSRSVRLGEVAPLLLSPWLDGWEQEGEGRAAWDAGLRRRNVYRQTLPGLARSAAANGLPKLAGVLERLAAWDTSRRTATAWVRRTHDLLAGTGWLRAGLGDAARPARDVRQMNALRDALQHLAGLDAVTGTLDWNGFLARLRRVCAAGELAAAARYANVAVLPLQEAAGLQCDHALVMGMDDASFPFVLPPHPMIPPPLAARLRMPGGDGAQDYRTAAWLWDQVAALAPAVECTHALQRDGVESGPSAFIADLPLMEAPGGGDELAERPPLEVFADAPEVPLPEDEEAQTGGVAVLRDQSACPFRAFVRHRLRARPLEEAEPGVAAAAKGGLLHAALEHLWGEMGKSERLKGMDAELRRSLIEEAIEHAWRRLRPVLDEAQAAVERARMRRLLRAWLQMEERRPPFSVHAREMEATLTLPASGARRERLQLRLRIDRLDEDVEGRRIVLDYKSGRGGPAREWLGERPAEPQLPAYALALDLGPRDAVAFARLRTGDMGFEGLAGEEAGIPGISTCERLNPPRDWRDVRAQWREALDQLAREFVSGRCEVAPRDARVCEGCGLEAACRIGERQGA